MKIEITKAQFDLLTKRNAAKAEAEKGLRTAQLAVNMAQGTYDALVAAMNDCIIQLNADYTSDPIGEIKSVTIKALPDGKTFELELV